MGADKLLKPAYNITHTYIDAHGMEIISKGFNKTPGGNVHIYRGI